MCDILIIGKIYIITIAVLFQEREHHKTELQQIRRENASLDTQFHESDKSINQLRSTVAVLQQEIKDKEQVNTFTYNTVWHENFMVVKFYGLPLRMKSCWDFNFTEAQFRSRSHSDIY